MSIFNGLRPQFKDFTMHDDYLTCYIGFAKYGWRFQKAQEWLEKTIVEKMTPVMPYRTGKLVNKTIEVNAATYGDGLVRTYGLPYGQKLYSGINPKTGQPWHWTNPLTQPYWGMYVVQTYGPDIKKGIRRMILRGK